MGMVHRLAGARRNTGWQLAVAFAWLLGAAGCGASCAGEDQGAAQLAHARGRYEALLAEGRQPQDSAFDAVLAELDAVATHSKARAQAAALAVALRRARQVPAPPLPLAVPSAPGPTSLEARQAACARLAEQLGTVPMERRAELSAALQQCQRDVARLREAAHDGRDVSP